MQRLGLYCAGVLLAAQVSAEPRPPLWGYGVKSCDEYARVWLGVGGGLQKDIAAYRRYQDWLSGFVSGLNTATGMDVLAGADLDGALRRIYLYCEDHRRADVYTAVRDLVRQLAVTE